MNVFSIVCPQISISTISFLTKSYYNDIEELGTSKVVLNNSCEVIFCKSEKRYEVNEMYDFFFKSFFFQKHLEKINKNNDKK